MLTRYRYVYCNNLKCFTYSVTVFPSLKQRLIFAQCFMTKKNTTYAQHCYDPTNWAATFILSMRGNHTMSYLVYVIKKTCAAAAFPELHVRRRWLMLYKPKISSFIFTQNNILWSVKFFKPCFFPLPFLLLFPLSLSSRAQTINYNNRRHLWRFHAEGIVLYQWNVIHFVFHHKTRP